MYDVLLFNTEGVTFILEALFNLLWPSDVTWYGGSGSRLVQVKTSHILGANPLLESMLSYCPLNHCEQISVNLIQTIIPCFQENSFENTICQMESIVFRPQCVYISSWNCSEQSAMSVISYDFSIDTHVGRSCGILSSLYALCVEKCWWGDNAGKCIDVRELCHHWFKQWLGACSRHQAIT